MKIKEFITEAGFGIGMDLVEPKADNNDHIKWANLIKKNCQPFLQQAKGSILYRGLGQAKEPFMTKKVRLGDRKPSDMPLRVHKKLNTYFTMKFGEPFRNAMFVTGSRVESEQYGSTYVIYPVGTFGFLWSPKIEDLYIEQTSYEPNTYKLTSEKLFQYEKRFYVEVIENNYQDTNLKAAIDSNHEIMMRPKKYYAVRNDIHNEILKLL